MAVPIEAFIRGIAAGEYGRMLTSRCLEAGVEMHGRALWADQQSNDFDVITPNRGVVAPGNPN